MEYEEVEEIPWSSLVVSDEQRRPGLALVAGGALVVVVVGIVIVRALVSGPSDPPGMSVAPDVATTAGTPVTASTEVQLLSEADLMAVLPEEQTRAAAAFAEQFVFDYFTVDGEAERSEALHDALPAAVEIPDVPKSDAVTYVEWVKAIKVEPLSIDEYLVKVGYRLLTGASGEFARQPLAAVDVRVGVDGNGGVLVLDLPAPSAIERAVFELTPVADSELPPMVIDAAEREGLRWGDAASVISGGEHSGVYRVVLAVRNGGDASWPLALWLDSAGIPVAAPKLRSGP